MWDEVRITYEKCLSFLEESSDTEPSDLDVVSSKYQVTYLAYIKCLGAINDKLTIVKNSNSPVNIPHNSENVSHHLMLPPCDVDTFIEDYISWPSFRDLFTALYINSSRLSNIERLCHLLRRTEDEARDIVSKCALSHEVLR